MPAASVAQLIHNYKSPLQNWQFSIWPQKITYPPTGNKGVNSCSVIGFLFFWKNHWEAQEKEVSGFTTQRLIFHCSIKSMLSHSFPKLQNSKLQKFWDIRCFTWLARKVQLGKSKPGVWYCCWEASEQATKIFNAKESPVLETQHEKDPQNPIILAFNSLC